MLNTHTHVQVHAHTPVDLQGVLPEEYLDDIEPLCS